MRYSTTINCKKRIWSNTRAIIVTTRFDKRKFVNSWTSSKITYIFHFKNFTLFFLPVDDNFRRLTKYKTPGRLCRHLALTHKVSNFPKFSTKKPYRTSKQRQKKNKEKVDTNPTPKCRWQCEIEECGRWFASRQNVNVHVLTVHEDRREHVCAQCARAFQRTEHLTQHTLREHTRTRPFKCTECDASFNDKQYLRKHHINRHTDLLPYAQ
jgi:hypothetical protein